MAPSVAICAGSWMTGQYGLWRGEAKLVQMFLPGGLIRQTRLTELGQTCD
jgi:hypothetical protein